MNLEMHQTRKGRQWYFGMKSHIGVDAGSGAVHTVVAIAANAADVNQAYRFFLQGDEHDPYRDASYRGVEKRPEN